MKAKFTEKERAQMFLLLLEAAGMPTPEVEFLFDERPKGERRRWRFDFAWVGCRLALEVQGAIWVQGKHGRGSGIVLDNEKGNAAAVLGWRVLKVEPKNLCTLETLQLVHDALQYHKRR